VCDSTHCSANDRVGTVRSACPRRAGRHQCMDSAARGLTAALKVAAANPAALLEWILVPPAVLKPKRGECPAGAPDGPSKSPQNTQPRVQKPCRARIRRLQNSGTRAGSRRTPGRDPAGVSSGATNARPPPVQRSPSSSGLAERVGGGVGRSSWQPVHHGPIVPPDTGEPPEGAGCFVSDGVLGTRWSGWSCVPGPSGICSGHTAAMSTSVR
jgi:hypothetical protein